MHCLYQASKKGEPIKKDGRKGTKKGEKGGKEEERSKPMKSKMITKKSWINVLTKVRMFRPQCT